MKNLAIGKQIAIGFTVVLTLGIAIILPIVMNNIIGLSEDAERRELQQLATSAKAEIASEGRTAEALSGLVANLTGAQRSLAEGDRDYLSANMVPAFKYMKEVYAVRQFQFHLPPATSFLRVHKPEKFGDDLSSIRATIIETNRSREPVLGLEKGRAGLGIRGLTPIFHEGQHVGSVEFGMSFGQPFFEQFKEKYGVDIALYLPGEEGFKPFAATRKDGPALDEARMHALMNGEETPLLRIEREGTPYAVHTEVVSDFSGKPVGVMEIMLDRSHYVANIDSARNTIILLGVLALIGGLGVALLIGRSITAPIKQAMEAMNDIAEGEGDLTKRLPAEGRNEVAQLSGAFNRFAAKVQTMVKEIADSTHQLGSAAEQMS